VLAAAADPRCPWVAHNAAFERAILEYILIPRHGWPMVPVARHVCTMALALAHAYPGSLESVAEVLGLVNRKDTAREKIVRKMWRPRKPRRGEDPSQLYWEDWPELRAHLYAYNRQDVAVERELHQHPQMRALPTAEQDVWVIDAEINDRGVCIDVPLATAASALATQALAELDDRIRRETDGAVDKASKREKLKTWLVTQGVTLPRRPKKRKSGLQWETCLEAEDIEQLLAGDLPHPGVRMALEIRLQAAQSAASKVNRMLKTRCVDGRVRNLYRIYGAVTGRWSGEGFQPQNLKRPELLQTDEAIAEAIATVLAGDYTAAKERYGDVLGVIGDLCRSMLTPAPGHRFIVGDFTTIEARTLAFLAGDAGSLETFRQFDRGLGRDLYCVIAEQVLGLAEVHGKSPERQLGKIFELALGYGMGAGKLLATIRKANVPDTERISVAETTRWVRKWREQNPAIVGYWAALDAAAMAAVRDPGMPVPCGTVGFQMRDGVLFARLPSGRELSYPAPVVKPGRLRGAADHVHEHGGRATTRDADVRRQVGRECYLGGRAGPAGRRDEAAAGCRLQARPAHPRRDRSGDAVRRRQPRGIQVPPRRGGRLGTRVADRSEGVRVHPLQEGLRRMRNPCLDAAIAELRDAGHLRLRDRRGARSGSTPYALGLAIGAELASGHPPDAESRRTHGRPARAQRVVRLERLVEKLMNQTRRAAKVAGAPRGVPTDGTVASVADCQKFLKICLARTNKKIQLIIYIIYIILPPRPYHRSRPSVATVPARGCVT
jgi:DNA polymerase